MISVKDGRFGQEKGLWLRPLNRTRQSSRSSPPKSLVGPWPRSAAQKSFFFFSYSHDSFRYLPSRSPETARRHILPTVVLPILKKNMGEGRFSTTPILLLAVEGHSDDSTRPNQDVSEQAARRCARSSNISNGQVNQAPNRRPPRF